MRALIGWTFLAFLVWLPVPAWGAGPEALVTFDDLPMAPGNSVPGVSLLMVCEPGAHGLVPANLYGRNPECKARVGAVVDALDAAATLAPVGRVYCPPGGSVHWLEAADAFVAWARQHPEQMDVPSGFLVVEALRQRWPCHERGS